MEEQRCVSPTVAAVPKQNDICLTVKLDANLSESLEQTLADTLTHFPLECVEKASRPLAHGNGPLIVGHRGCGAIHTGA